MRWSGALPKYLIVYSVGAWGFTSFKKLKPGSHITVMVDAVLAVVSKAEYDYGRYLRLVPGTAGRVQSRTVREKESHECLMKWSFS